MKFGEWTVLLEFELVRNGLIVSMNLPERHAVATVQRAVGGSIFLVVYIAKHEVVSVFN